VSDRYKDPRRSIGGRAYSEDFSGASSAA